MDVSPRTVLSWTQTFGPQTAVAARPHRRQFGRRWYVEEVFLFRGAEKRYLYRAVDQQGQVIDVLLRQHRDLASAEAFFRRALATTGLVPTTVVSDHHQPYVSRPSSALRRGPDTSAPACTAGEARPRSASSAVMYRSAIGCDPLAA